MEATASPARVWEHMELTAADNDSPLGVEVAVRDGYVYVTLSRRAQVKLFTILGQAVSQTELPAGTSRLRMAEADSSRPRHARSMWCGFIFNVLR